ncbi:MAG: SPOR domain-containing protein [Xanthomonadaceae bacterium]|nr:SPOR domain-containing protein [Xanthomonadaceae bacterium]
MIRAVTLLLLVANLLLFGWAWTRAPDAASTPAAPALQASPLVLLAELPAPLPAAAIPQDNPPEQPTEADAEAPACQGVGPFSDRDAVIAARDELLDAGIAALPSAVDASQRLGFWVHTRPAATREEAAAIIDRLRRAGIRDFYVVTEGEISNAVSLGVFGRPETAEQHAARLRAMGFDVVVGERRREMTAWWLEFPVPATGSPGETALADLVMAGNGLTLEPRRCEE